MKQTQETQVGKVTIKVAQVALVALLAPAVLVGLVAAVLLLLGTEYLIQREQPTLRIKAGKAPRTLSRLIAARKSLLAAIRIRS